MLYREAHTLLEELGDDAGNRKEYADFSARVHIPNLALQPATRLAPHHGCRPHPGPLIVRVEPKQGFPSFNLFHCLFAL